MPISVNFIPSERKFQRRLDPSGKLDYTVDWSQALGDSSISDVNTVLSPDSISAGLELSSQAIQGSTVTVRFEIASEDQEDPSFDPPDGVELPFKQTMTDSTGQIWELSFSIPVVQQ